MYRFIFVTNVLRLLQQQGLTKQELADKARLSVSYLSDLTNLKGNPTLDVMEQLATALDTPLPLLLEATDLDPASLAALSGGEAPPSSLPPGFKRVSGVLPAVRAFLFQEEVEATRKFLQGKS